MSIAILVDMNLSPEWVPLFQAAGWAAIHWSKIGDPCAADQVLMDWAKANQHVVFTHDLDFSTMLALTHDTGPSVIQVRGRNVLPENIGTTVIKALKQFQTEIEQSALVVIDEKRARVRVLPL